MNDWSSKKGKLIVDGDHYTYWNSESLTYVRDGKGYPYSTVGPHFLDVGIMGFCTKNCYNCYMQDRRVDQNMSAADADALIYKFKNSLCQVSFGGAGDPFDHPQFADLPYCGSKSSRKDVKASGFTGAETDEELVQARAEFNVWNEPVANISRCVTINPEGRAFTPQQVSLLASFKAVGLSLGTSFNNGHADMLRLVRQAEAQNWETRPRFVLHLIIGSYHNDLRPLTHLLTHSCVDGILLLADKSSRPASPGNIFYNREYQKRFWESVAAVYDVVKKPIAVDSCLAPLVDRKLFPSFNPRAMHPCDAGRFSAYVHADGKMWLCSCGKQPVEVWQEAWKKTTHTKQSCERVSASGKDVLRTEWRNPDVIIQHGPMTNSSSSSYFVIAPERAKLKLDVLDFVGRDKLTDYGSDWGFSWYANNKRLVKITPGEWASWCAEDISYDHEPAKRKKLLDSYTKQIVAGAVPYYLVANRDDGCVSPTSYDQSDVSEDKRVVLIEAGEEH